MTSITTRCPHCQAMNRLPTERIEENGQCGKCKQPLLAGKPIEGSLDNFDALIQGNKPVVVDFWAAWCGPCKSFAPVFSLSAQEKGDSMRFVKVDTEQQQELATRYRIRSIPCMMVFQNGELKDTLNGALPKQEFNHWLDQALNK